VEAAALQAPASLGRTRRSLSPPLLRLRSDEQLVSLFRAGHEEAFRAIHDRYRARLFAYVRQMLAGSRPDAEDALQDVFVRAYRALRASDHEISLRAWLYRVAHNRCVDELRRPVPPSPEVMSIIRAPEADPLAETVRRESLQRLVSDVRRLPEHQRSALLMRELNGLSYVETADALGTSVPAVKSLLVRARMGLAQAAEARDAACGGIREELTAAHDGGERASALARRHLRDCSSCRAYRGELRSVSRDLAALVPPVGLPAAILAKLLGGGGAAAGGSAAAGGGAAAGSGAVSVSVGVLAAAATKVAAVVCVAVVTAGGAEVMTSGSVSHHAPKTPGSRASAPAGSSTPLAALAAPALVGLPAPAAVRPAPPSAPPPASQAAPSPPTASHAAPATHASPVSSASPSAVAVTTVPPATNVTGPGTPPAPTTIGGPASGGPSSGAPGDSTTPPDGGGSGSGKPSSGDGSPPADKPASGQHPSSGGDRAGNPPPPAGQPVPMPATVGPASSSPDSGSAPR